MNTSKRDAKTCAEMHGKKRYGKSRAIDENQPKNQSVRLRLNAAPIFLFFSNVR